MLPEEHGQTLITVSCCSSRSDGEIARGESKFSLALRHYVCMGLSEHSRAYGHVQINNAHIKRVNSGVSDWPFGQVWFEQRQYCDCGAPVFEILRCSGVVQLYLSAKGGSAR